MLLNLWAGSKKHVNYTDPLHKMQGIFDKSKNFRAERLSQRREKAYTLID